MNLISLHLRSLIRFSGREARQPFWLWVLAVVATATVVSMAYFFVMFAGLFGRIDQFAREHPDQVTRTVGPGSYSISINGYHPEIAPDFSMPILVISVIALIVITLLAAAVARRLHDTGRMGWWGLPAPLLLLGGLANMVRMFAALHAQSGDPINGPPAAFFAGFALTMLLNLAYLLSLVLLIVLCSGESQPAENRYGMPPRDLPR